MARVCDSCVRKRARWYCATDDAFLFQSCDNSIHGADQAGGQHERVLLKIAAPSKLVGSGELELEPTWHHGFTRRARTPRRAKCYLKVEGKNKGVNSSVHVVPEIGSLDASLLDDSNDDEEQEKCLVYCVPVFDPFETELCNDSNEIGRSVDDIRRSDHPTDDLELLEFAADVESLLGKEFDNDNNTSCRIEDLGLTNNYKEDDIKNIGTCFDENIVKVEDKEVETILGFDFDATKETLDWDFDFESSMMIKEEGNMTIVLSDQCHEGKSRTSSMLLRLNYEDVINSWDDQGSPWTNGTRPELNSDDYWPDLMGTQWAWSNNPSYRGIGGRDGGREARVSRYREKRRSRLFSKKIRYEVRKLNAEKRPRMKGRFVKKETFELPPSTSSFPTYVMKNN
ncbi:zinc finger protein CONSTANS-LIKE 16-like [Bidens hawaiensis]|uniref:zinc finger protein CONSTANS-LIKE 16-like n=1 Tax=Bidens hawaiensis TaxID=980011 RepID=UPI00404B4912